MTLDSCKEVWPQEPSNRLTSFVGWQAHVGFGSEALVRPLVQLLQHPDDDVQERTLLGLVALASHAGPRKSINAAGGRAAVAAAEKRLQLLLRDADEEHLEILKDLGVLLGDLADMLSVSEIDRTEL